ncbi:MAG: 23S rRNA (uracil(1939)-C(5))-methyltransferase RlmD [Candidatus Woesearchaeota archaeon]
MQCEHFGVCGGCSLQHVPYEEQVKNKQKRLNALFNTDLEVFTGPAFGYRNRMDFIFSPKGLGLRKKREWKTIIPIKECLIADPAINAIVKEVNSHFRNPDYFDMKKKSGTLRHAVIRITSMDSSISFVLNSDSSRLASAVKRIRSFAELTTANNVFVTYVQANDDLTVSDDYFTVKGRDYLLEKLGSLTFSIPVQGFFQNNINVASQMLQYVSEHLFEGNHLVDLYGGVGVFGLTNAHKFSQTTIIESVGPATHHAVMNAKRNNLDANIICKDARQLGRLELETPLSMITDPPRSGMHPHTVSAIKKIAPRQLFYISCNPDQQKREISHIGYSIKRCALFDLFPQTPHIESVLELEKRYF